MNSIFIEAKEWFDKTYGNSYFSARIEIDGEPVAFLPFQYGYERQYEHEALKTLKQMGIISETVKTIYDLKQTGISVYSVKSEAKYRDAKRFGLDWRIA